MSSNRSRLSLFILLSVCFALLLSAAQATAQSETAKESFNALVQGKTEFGIDWRGSFNSTEQQQIYTWLGKSVHTAAQLYGEFPLSKSRIVVNRSDRRGGPVPWGQTVRDGVEGVSFTVNPDKSLDDFVADWTAPHEFSHLFIPYPGQRDSWLSEGFASYYQNILMAREGIYSPEQAWQKLVAGFIRAEREGSAKKPLAEVSENRRESRATMRIYWSGALYFLEADIALRQNHLLQNKLSQNNKQFPSLDSVVKEFNHCCRNRFERWNGEKLVTVFDEIAETHLFTELYQQYSQSIEIPDSAPILASLGITVENGALGYSNNSELQSFREALTDPRLKPMELLEPK